MGVAQAKPACKHTIATRKCYQYNQYNKIPPGTSLGGVGQLFLGSNNSQINPHMRAKFGRGPTVVKKKNGGYCRAAKRNISQNVKT